jgi:hypothetical protein
MPTYSALSKQRFRFTHKVKQHVWLGVIRAVQDVLQLNGITKAQEDVEKLALVRSVVLYIGEARSRPLAPTFIFQTAAH